MGSITVDVHLYGELSCYGKSKHQSGNHSNSSVQLPMGSTLQNLLDYLLMCTNERGFTFINEKLSARPSHQPDLDHVLQDGDQVIFYPLNLLPTALDFDMSITNRMTRTVRADENLNLYYHYE